MPLIKKFSCGDVIDNRYHLDIRIHEGRWGDIFRATDSRNDRPVAIRLFSSTEEGPADAAGFASHVGKVAGLKSPGMSVPKDHGTYENVLYTVNRWARGQPLEDEILERGPFTREQTLVVMHAVLKALDKAHQLRLTHGLLRPSKIVVDELDGERPYITIVDFEIWRLYEFSTGDDAFEEGNLSRRLIRYTAPEVLQDHCVIPPTDLYSVGLVAIEMLTGQPAFNENHRIALIARQLDPEIVELDASVDVGPAFREFLNQLLTKDPHERLSPAGEALRILEEKRDLFLNQERTTDEVDAPEVEESEVEEPKMDAAELTELDKNLKIPEIAEENEELNGKSAPMAVLNPPKKKGKSSKSKSVPKPSGLPRPKRRTKPKSALPMVEESEPDLDPDEELFGTVPSEVEAIDSPEAEDEEFDFLGNELDEQGDDFFGDGIDFGDSEGDYEDDHDEIELDRVPDNDRPNRPAAGTKHQPDSDFMGDRADDIDLDIGLDTPKSEELPPGTGSIPTPGISPRTQARTSTPPPEKKSGPPLAIGIVVVAVLAIGAFFFLNPGADSEADSLNESAAAENESEEEDVGPMQSLRITTSPPALRVLVEGHRPALSPLEIEVPESAFPIRVRARMDANNEITRTIESPQAEYHIDFAAEIAEE